MNLVEKNQNKGWIVRVHDREYGPVDLDELRTWKLEGRLIRENEIREAGSDRWIRAGELPEIFADELAQGSGPPPLVGIVRRVSLGQILAAGWRVYRAGFVRFLALAAIVSIPSLVLQLAAPFLEMPKDHGSLVPLITAATIAFVSLVLLVIAWPFSLAATQLLADDLYAGRNPKLGDILNRAKPLWRRMFSLGLIVYGSYVLWAILPTLVALSLTPAADSLTTLLLMMAMLIFAAYMVARLFINFLFWEQAGALGGGSTIEALQESKDLARGGTDRSRWQRPLYRGALIASVWLLVIIILNVGIELPVMLFRMRGVTSLEQAAAMMQSMATPGAPDFLSGLTTALSCLGHAILRPLLATTFVVLYLETRHHAARSK